MSIKTHIKDLIRKPNDTQLLSIRVPSILVNQVDELTGELDVSRTDLVLTFIRGGIEEVRAELDRQSASQPEANNFSQAPNDQSRRYFLLNTNYNNSQSDHYEMLENEEAAAFYPGWKEKIGHIKDGDLVFLYQSGAGICAFGIAEGELRIRDHEGNEKECYSKSLGNFRIVPKPLTAKECKDATRTSMNFRKVMVLLPSDQGEALMNALESRIAN